MGTISELEPKCVFEQFEKIISIPRTSGNEKQISDYLVEFAGKRGFIAYQDKLCNVTILKPATPGMEEKDTIILQAHMDMVGAIEEGSNFDFNKDSIEAFVEDNFIKSKGTTLGADNGIGMAIILAILESDDLAHPMIEAVFTVGEEVGLDGANGYDYSKLKGRKLINLDTEEENHIVIGCAGGCRCNISDKCKKEKVEGILYEIIVSNLTGGHSGCEIHKDRANANVLMGRILAKAIDSCELSLVSMEGGTLDNAICTHCKAVVAVKKKNTKDFEKTIDNMRDDIKREYSVSDPDMKIKIKEKGKEKVEAVSDSDFKRIIGLLLDVPNGVAKYSQEMPKMVVASSNVGIVRVKPKQFCISLSLRGNRNSYLDNLKRRVSALAFAFDSKLEIVGNYVPWEACDNNELAEKILDVYKKKFNRDIEIVNIHAGLECALFCNNIKNLEAVSIGPDIFGAHTTGEKVDIDSVKREWELVKEILVL